MSRRFALHLHPDKGHWQLPGSFSLNTHTYTHTHTHTHTHSHTHTHKGTLQNTAVLYLSISFFLSLTNTHTNFRMYTTFISFIQPDIFPMEIWSYTKVKNRSLCYFILNLKYCASSWEPRESVLASL